MNSLCRQFRPHSRTRTYPNCCCFLGETAPRVCPKCSSVYHLETRPPASAGVCDACGSALVQRPDDTEEVIRGRLRVYNDQTLPVAEIYRQRGLLRETEATGSPETVAERLRQTVGQR